MCASLVSERAAITRFLDPHYLMMGLTTKARKFQVFLEILLMMKLIAWSDQIPLDFFKILIGFSK